MPRSFAVLVLVASNFLAACADDTVTRQEVADGPLSLLSFENNVRQENVVSQQAHALNDLSQDIVVASTIRGAKIGAAVGCGLALVSAANAQKCVSGAVAGGVIGAINGHQAGKRQIATRVELVDPNQLVRSIRATNTSVEELTKTLPQLLAAQDKELETLAFQRDMGTLSQAAYEKRYLQIQSHRSQLAQSLSLSTKQANLAGDNLEHAATQGQTGLEWHFGAARNIARQTESARSTISLL
jgi:hypothetical protein